MSNYIKILPDSPHFTQNGREGYKYNLETKELGLYIEVSHKGLDKYVYDKESTHNKNKSSNPNRLPLCI